MNKKMNTRKLVLCALLMALILLLTMTPLGYITIPPVSITTIHVPVMVGAALLGPAYGAFLGLVFGISSVIRAFMVPTAMSAIIIQSAVSTMLVLVVPRIICGWVPGLIFRAMARRGRPVLGAGVSAAAGTLTNTVLFLGMFLLTNPGQTAWLAPLIGGIVLTNSVPETIVAVAVSMGVYRAGRRYFQREMNSL